MTEMIFRNPRSFQRNIATSQAEHPRSSQKRVRYPIHDSYSRYRSELCKPGRATFCRTGEDRVARATSCQPASSPRGFQSHAFPPSVRSVFRSVTIKSPIAFVASIVSHRESGAKVRTCRKDICTERFLSGDSRYVIDRITGLAGDPERTIYVVPRETERVAIVCESIAKFCISNDCVLDSSRETNECNELFVGTP